MNKIIIYRFYSYMTIIFICNQMLYSQEYNPLYLQNNGSQENSIYIKSTGSHGNNPNMYFHLPYVGTTGNSIFEFDGDDSGSRTTTFRFKTSGHNIFQMRAWSDGTQSDLWFGDVHNEKLKINDDGVFNVFNKIQFPQVAFNGNQSQTILNMPANTDGAELISEQPNSDEHHVILRMKDNITNDRFRIWFDEWRGSEYDRNPLEVRGDRVLLAQDGGNVGIGTTNPSYKLDVNGGNFYVIGTNRDWGGTGGLGTHIGTGDFDIYSGNPGSGTHRLRVSNAGNVGIGTTTPSHKLSVAGTINSEEIIVEENVGADFVFEASYDLPTLQDIEAFIEQNQHLPGIAPASQMIEEGVKVGELQMQLLQKIEELTLYTIEQEKKIEAHKNENESMMMLIKSLSQRIKHLEQHEN